MFPEYTNPTWDTHFGSGIHHKASRENDVRENDVRDNVMVRIRVGRETCIRDKDMDPEQSIIFRCVLTNPKPQIQIIH